VIKEAIDRIKSAASLIGGIAIFLLFGWVYYLVSRVESLKSKVARTQAEKQMVGTLEKLEEAQYEANEKEKLFRNDLADYRDARKQYDGGSGEDKT
jgi:hypothetical protein